MIKEIMQPFKLMYEKHGDNLIYDTRKLTIGTYVIVDVDNNLYEIFNINGKNDVISPSVYKNLNKMDYLSSLITMDKPVDSKKTIHSNNYMSLFIKKSNLSKDIISDTSSTKNIFNALDRYYESIKNIVPDEKTRKKDEKEKLKMYKVLENKLMDIDSERLEKNKKWLKDNILNLKNDPQYIDDENYLKIFFKDTDERFLNEYNRYLVPKIYNSNKHNIYLGDVLYGLPGDNMQLNVKKIPLKQMTRKNYCPNILTLNDAFFQYKFFNYLTNFAMNGEKILYIDEEGFYTYEQIKERKKSFNGYLLKIKKDKTLNIVGFKVVMGYKPKELKKEFDFKNMLEVKHNPNLKKENTKPIKYGKVRSLLELHDLIDEVIFCKFLKTNYFSEELTVKSNDLKRIIELSRNAMFGWFYEGREKEGYITLKRLSMDILKSSIYQGNFTKAKIQFNLLYSLAMYYESGGNEMNNIIKDIREQLIEKIDVDIDTGETQYIDTDEQYYFSVGQLVKFLLSLRNTSKVNQSTINAILNSKNDEKLKLEVEKLYKRYNHSKYIGKKFNRLYAMILSYTPSEKIDSTTLLAGFLGNSILKNKKQEVSMDETTVEEASNRDN